MVGLIGLFGAAMGRDARGASLEGLLMPGPLSTAHAALESDCSNCHDRADRSRQRQLCLGCHKNIAADLNSRRGLHGARPELATAQCGACHSEHLGRTARIQPQLPVGFDHARTGFRLDDSHLGVSCSSCHATGKKYRDAPTGCVDCHRKIEPHAGRLGNECAACHRSSAWREVRYDHGATRFPLQGAHATVPCAACHAGNRWKETPRACASCHTPDDVHRGQRGADCASCHTQNSWTETRFDHARETGFALLGVHKQAACQACHRSGRFEDKLPRDCSGCHAAADAHAGRMGVKCETCHAEAAWRDTRFEHSRDTKFTLTGAHATAACHSCHVASLAQSKPSQQCSVCHRAVDVHGGTLGTRCENCHATVAWRRDVSFDHDLSAFPLLGQHVAVPCAGCHTTQRFKDAAQDCQACHRSDDVHAGDLGRDCARCHNANGWNIWQFDHGKESGFGLTGAHARLQCNACHTRPAGEFKLARDCASCHSTDDVHLGQFGRRCERCHSTLSFHRATPP